MSCAPLAQLDRASGYEPGGRTFESCRAHHTLSGGFCPRTHHNFKTRQADGPVDVAIAENLAIAENVVNTENLRNAENFTNAILNRGVSAVSS